MMMMMKVAETASVPPTAGREKINELYFLIHRRHDNLPIGQILGSCEFESVGVPAVQ